MCFVAGGSYIGSICTEELLNARDAGHEFLINLTEGQHRSAVDPRAKFIEKKGNLERFPNWSKRSYARPRANAIMHAAASALVSESMSPDPQKYFPGNLVRRALKLADAAVECGIKKFVFSSTCATYGPPDRIPMTEDLPQNPINPRMAKRS